MTSKTISIDPQLLKLSGKKKPKTSRVLPSQLNINSNNIRQMLIEKLRKSRKTQRMPPKINTNSFDNYSPPSYLEPKLVPENESSTNLSSTVPVNINNFPEKVVSDNIITTVIQPDKPYGILKNGTKPTYKNWCSSQKNYDSIKNDIPIISEITEKVIEPIVNDRLPDNEIILETPMIQEREIKKTFTIGKNKKSKSIGVLIKNIHTRKKVEEDILKHKKTNITTVKNYLKGHNMIKHGTTAPTNLLRTMYENMKLCGDVANDNINNLIHNFEKD